MRIALTLLLLAAQGFAQIPEQGPPPKNLTKLADGHVTANSDAANVENFEVHVVVSGDTLSAISGSVLKNSRLWPQLWEENDHIVNPHWIYPNDVILIRPVVPISEATPPPVDSDQASTDEAPAPPPPPPPAPREPFRLNVSPAAQNDAPPKPQFDLTPPRTFPQVKAGDVKCAGFIRANGVDDNMPVIARFNSDNGILAGETDYIYLGQGIQDGVKNGTTYQVIRPTRRIESQGTHYLNVAEVRTVLVQAEYSLARVIQNCEAVEVGDLLIPSETATVPTLTEKRPFSPTMMASGQMRGSVITTKDALVGYGSGLKLSGKIPGLDGTSGDLGRAKHGFVNEGGIVYVDIGRDEAVRPGDVFIVFRNVDVENLARSPGREIVRRQRTAIGELVILKVEDLASSALVTYSTDGIALGDAVERR